MTGDLHGQDPMDENNEMVCIPFGLHFLHGGVCVFLCRPNQNSENGPKYRAGRMLNVLVEVFSVLDCHGHMIVFAVHLFCTGNPSSS
jgi:hypothetical protein